MAGRRRGPSAGGAGLRAARPRHAGFGRRWTDAGTRGRHVRLGLVRGTDPQRFASGQYRRCDRSVGSGRLAQALYARPERQAAGEFSAHREIRRGADRLPGAVVFPSLVGFGGERGGLARGRRRPQRGRQHLAAERGRFERAVAAGVPAAQIRAWTGAAARQGRKARGRASRGQSARYSGHRVSRRRIDLGRPPVRRRARDTHETGRRHQPQGAPGDGRQFLGDGQGRVARQGCRSGARRRHADEHRRGRHDEGLGLRRGHRSQDGQNGLRSELGGRPHQPGSERRDGPRAGGARQGPTHEPQAGRRPGGGARESRVAAAALIAGFQRSHRQRARVRHHTRRFRPA